MKKANEKYCYELVITLFGQTNRINKLWTFSEFGVGEDGMWIAHRADGPARIRTPSPDYPYKIGRLQYRSRTKFEEEPFHKLSGKMKVSLLKAVLLENQSAET